MRNFSITGISIILISLLFSFQSDAQCTLRGKITDSNGESLPGAVVALKYNRSLGTVTDLDGDYSLKLPDSVSVIVQFSMIGLQPSEEKVIVVKGGVVVRNVTLKSSAQEMKEVEVTAKAVRSNDYYFETIKKKSAASIDFISADVMKKTGDNTVTAAIARVSGVSTTAGLITVRGIGDRYVKTTINGSRIPTLDPFTNNIRLDILPTGLVDNIVLTKTYMPDLPGDWAGAYISVETKDYPEQLMVGVETTFGYNTQASLQDVISSQRSKTDWLGFDASLRDRSHDVFNYAYMDPTRYQQLCALGLTNYYNSLGVNQNNWGEGTTQGEYYYRLGLVQLGLLAPAQINDASAVASATQQYDNGPYRNQAFDVLNAPAAATGQSFSNNWNTFLQKAPLNFSQTFSIGNQSTLFGKTVGYIFGLRYNESVAYDPSSTLSKASVSQDSSGNLVPFVASYAEQQVSRWTNGWSALFNVSMKFNSNNSLSLTAMPNFTGVNNVRFAVDKRDYTQNVITNSQFYEQRRQLVYQLRSQHYLPALKAKIDFSTSYTGGKSTAPDFKNVQYYYEPISANYQIGGAIGDGIHRYYRYLDENVWDNHLRFEIPVATKEGLSRKLATGFAFQYNYRLSDQYDYFINLGPYSTLKLKDNDLNTLFDLSNFALSTYTDPQGVDHRTLNTYYGVFSSPANKTFGNSTIAAAFIQSDFELNSLWRIAGGLRVEKANILTDVVLFDSLGYAPNDPRRSYSSSYPLANPGKLDKVDVLPSLNVIYKLRNTEDSPINLRVNYSRTLARPSIRELSDVAQLDYEYRLFVFGNSDLKEVRISNYDVRFESYNAKGENFSASLFYKNFKDHIEIVKSVGLTWQNVDKSEVAGLELEGMKKLGSRFEVRANVSLIYSRTEFVRKRLDLSEGVKQYYPLDTIRRPMFGQAPYVFNAIINYKPEKYGLNFTLSYNLQGPRLAIAADVKEIPDIYELPRQLIDVKGSKTLGKHFTVSATIKDLLNAPIRRSYKYDEGYTLDFDKFRFGTVFQLAVSYKL